MSRERSSDLHAASTARTQEAQKTSRRNLLGHSRQPSPGSDGRSPEHTSHRDRSRKWRRAAVLVAIVVLALVAGGTFVTLSTSDTGTGNPLVEETHGPAPAFSLSDLLVPTRTISLSDYRGKELVLNFWASWCVACQAEMSLLESAYRSEHGNVKFLGIDTNDTRTIAQGFLARVHVTYPCAFDPHLQAASAYGIFGLPVTVFISANGKMLGRHIGQLDVTVLQRALRNAFGSSGSP